MNTLIDKFKVWWVGHAQKTIGSILGTLAGVDLVSSFTSYQSEITTLLGEKWYAAIRVAGAIIIVWRATHRPKQP